MKRICILCVAMIMATLSYAQINLVATLNHNDSISVYYGSSALGQAYNNAVGGDIITLSGGTFSSVNISKAVTIRGAGMISDDIASTDLTNITGNFTINIQDDSINHFTLEGVNANVQIITQSAYKPKFIKCRLGQVKDGTNSFTEAKFINCIMNSISSSMTQTQFINTIILNFGYYNPISSFYNCIVKTCNTNHTFYNSILYFEGVNNDTRNLSNSSSFNCIGINMYAGSGAYFSSQSHNCVNYYGMSSVFQSFTGEFAYSFELQDSVANTVLGTDGTQVGVYGGVFPFDLRVTNPVIKRINVANRSTADGKLSVDIEVVSEEEEQQ